MSPTFFNWIAVLVILTSCQSTQHDTLTVLSGQINNSRAPIANLTGINYNHQIKLNENGQFSDTVAIPYEGYFDFKVGRRVVSLYLYPGDKLNIDFNMGNFNRSIRITGSYPEPSNYLITKQRTKRKIENKTGQRSKMTESEFKKSTRASIDQLTQVIDTSKGLKASFIDKEKTDLEYYYLSNLLSYPKNHRSYSKNEDYQMSDEFLKEFEDFNYFDDQSYIHHPTYRTLSEMKFNELFTEEYNVNKSYGEALLNAAAKISKGVVRDEMMMTLIPHVFKPNETLKEVYDYFQAEGTNEEYKAQLTEQYNSLQYLAKGNKSPRFDYENINGGRTTLEELKGRYVYIDIWATWCGPCKREIPALKKLEQEYKDKNIAFVSISVDKPNKREAWQKMVEEKELGGYQLISENATNSDFMRYFKVRGIPHFIILDPEGNIYSAYAPRATNAGIRKLLDKLVG